MLIELVLNRWKWENYELNDKACRWNMYSNNKRPIKSFSALINITFIEND